MRKKLKQFKFTAVALSSTLRTHRLKVPKKDLKITSTFKLTPFELKTWFDFYQKHSPDHGKPQGDFPFFYFESKAALAFHKILSSLGVNFKNVLNLETEFNFGPHFDSGSILTTEYKMVTSLKEIFQFDNKKRAITHILVQIFKPHQDEAALTMHFNFLIKNVPVKDLKNIKHKEFIFTSRPEMKIGKGNEHYFKNKMNFSKNMGLEYGLISGDMNIVHTSWMMCKLFGIKKPFVQGLCVANYAVYKLGKRESGQLKNFKIQYCLPVFLDQDVEIRYNQNSFEIVDQENKILARGEFDRYHGFVKNQNAA